VDPERAVRVLSANASRRNSRRMEAIEPLSIVHEEVGKDEDEEEEEKLLEHIICQTNNYRSYIEDTDEPVLLRTSQKEDGIEVETRMAERGIGKK